MSLISFKHRDFHVAGCDLRSLAVRKIVYVMSNGRDEDDREKAWDIFRRFVKDPPIYLDEQVLHELNIIKNGATFYTDQNGITHILDWIGESFYPNASDILEECCFTDGSMLVKITKDLEKLVPGLSKRYLVHPRGIVLNPDVLLDNREVIPGVPYCFLNEDERTFHNDSREYCAALAWQWVEGAEKTAANFRLTTRKIGDWTYPCAVKPKGSELIYAPAIIAELDINEAHCVIGVPANQSDDINDAIQKTLELLGGMDIQLPLFATDN